MATLDVAQYATADRGGSANAQALLNLNRAGALVVVDWYTQAVLDGHGFQTRMGTITTPIVGDVAITDTAAEYCFDVSTSAFVMIPIYNNVSVRAGTGTAQEIAIKSVATVSSAGTAIVPLPMLNTGAAAASYGLSSRGATAGGVTVTAELVTTTLRHWSYSQQAVFTTGQVIIPDWQPLRPPVLVGARCLYVQIAAATTGPSYYASMDVLGFTAAQIGL